MTDEPVGGSPPCLACEMEDAYAGFLPSEELAAALTRLLLLAAAEPEAVGARWRAVLEPAIGRLPPAPVPAPIAATGDLVTEARALMPRIADNALHVALKGLVAS